MDPQETTPPPQARSSGYTLKLDDIFQACLQQQASDIYLTYGTPPCLRVGDKITPYRPEVLDDITLEYFLSTLLSEQELNEFESTLEINTSVNWQNRARFRINAYRQQQHTALVIRRIETQIPEAEALGLPKAYQELAMLKRGLILIVGQTGCGKSTSLAAMLHHRNLHGTGHIITIEDPIEFIHTPINCIISQRDIGIDTYSYGMALKNALRQKPDVILIGEIRDRDAMEHALNFSETGHLCLATLHSNNASQTIERILGFFPEEKHPQVLLNLSMNLRGILAQRLVPTIEENFVPATEVMLNEGLISRLIMEGNIKEIHDVMEKNREVGMQTFDQHLVDMYHDGIISKEVVFAECDNASSAKLSIKQKETADQLRRENSAIPDRFPTKSDDF